jgi:hypothetical protein
MYEEAPGFRPGHRKVPLSPSGLRDNTASVAYVHVKSCKGNDVYDRALTLEGSPHSIMRMPSLIAVRLMPST